MSRRVLITGAAGRIGSFLSDRLRHDHDLVLTDRVEPAAPQSNFAQAELTDGASMEHLCAGVDTVIHLAGNPSPEATWSELLAPNVEGVRTIYEAAASAGVKRVLFASSIHAVDGYPEDGPPIAESAAPRPRNLYGASKAIGEALGSVYAQQSRLSVVAIRIGWFADPTPTWYEHFRANRFGRVALMRDDFLGLVHACLALDTAVRFAVVHATSKVSSPRLSLSETTALTGWAPSFDVSEALASVRS